MIYPRISKEVLTTFLLICLKHILLEDSLKDAIIAIGFSLLEQLLNHTVSDERKEPTKRGHPQLEPALHQGQSFLATSDLTRQGPVQSDISGNTDRTVLNHPVPIVRLEPGDSEPSASREDKILPLERLRFLVGENDTVYEIKHWATSSDTTIPLPSVLDTAAAPILVFRGTSSGKWNKPQRQARRDRRFNEGLPPMMGFGREGNGSQDVDAEVGRYVIPTASTDMHHGEGTSDGTGAHFSVRGRSSSSESDRVPKKRRRRHR